MDNFRVLKISTNCPFPLKIKFQDELHNAYFTVYS